MRDATFFSVDVLRPRVIEGFENEKEFYYRIQDDIRTLREVLNREEYKHLGDE